MAKLRPKFACPSCGDRLSLVIQSRESPADYDAWQAEHWPGNGIWRRRQCVSCQHSYTTREYLWPVVPTSVSSRYI